MKKIRTHALSISAIPMFALLLFVSAGSHGTSSDEVLLPPPDPCTDPIVAVGSSGPNTCFVRGTFVDFQDLFGPSNVIGANWKWESVGTPSLPGFDTYTGQRLLRTYFIPSTLTPGCYKITVIDDNGVCIPPFAREVWIRVLANASDPCTPCSS